MVCYLRICCCRLVPQVAAVALSPSAFLISVLNSSWLPLFPCFFYSAKRYSPHDSIYGISGMQNVVCPFSSLPFAVLSFVKPSNSEYSEMEIQKYIQTFQVETNRFPLAATHRVEFVSCLIFLARSQGRAHIKQKNDTRRTHEGIESTCRQANLRRHSCTSQLAAIAMGAHGLETHEIAASVVAAFVCVCFKLCSEEPRGKERVGESPANEDTHHRR